MQKGHLDSCDAPYKHICVLEKLCSGLSYTAVGCELAVNQQYIFNKVSLKRNIHKTRLCTDWLNEMTRDSEEPNPEFPLGNFP